MYVVFGVVCQNIKNEICNIYTRVEVTDDDCLPWKVLSSVQSCPLSPGVVRIRAGETAAPTVQVPG